MYRLIRNVSVLVVLWSCALGKEQSEVEVLVSRPTRCSYEHAYEMYGAHCAGLKLTHLPSLRAGIEILDFSENKLRELDSGTFSGYSSIKFLYLADNQIYLIANDALSSLSYLQTLDLSRNVITELPMGIFQLPSLRKLYLSGNPLIHMNPNDIAIVKPIRAPIELLDLSDCKIQELPDLGSLPQLLFYNVSYNPLTSLDTKLFAQSCNLGKVDLTESTDRLMLCDLRPLITWFQEKHVFFQLSDYTKLNSREFESCPKEDISAVMNATHHSCKSEFLQVQNVRASRRTWLTIGGGLAGFLVGFILLLYLMHRRTVAQTKQADKKTAPPHDSDKQATAGLIDNAS